MRIAFDATAAATQRAGIGRYARELLRALLQLDAPDAYVLLAAVSAAQVKALEADLPPGAWRELRRLPLSERALTLAWQRARLPLSVERLLGDFDIFHGPDFVLPPTRHPAVVTIHDTSYLRFPQFAEPSLVVYLTHAVPRALARAAAVIAVSGAVALELAEAYPHVRDKLVVVPNGVTLPACQQPSEPHTTRPTVLTVGTIQPRKNLPTLLRAFELVRQDEPDAQLVIAGGIGWRADELVRAIRDAERGGGVRFVEAPDDARLEELYAAASVVVCASWHEGFGLPVLEAQARRVPVVASDIPALRETGGDAALYADPADPAAFAAALTRLLRDASLRDTLATAGRARAAQLTWTETARRTRRVYGRVAAS